jgi:ubiquitin-protein ligase
MRAHKFNNITDLKIASAKRQQSFGTERLLREVREIETNPFPYVNFSAKPAENNVYTWNILMQGPAESIYEGLFFKCVLKLPKNYPISPPTSIRVVDGRAPLHPFIDTNGHFCIERFGHRKKTLEGWNTMYTLSTIFQVLEGFMWEGHNFYEQKGKIAKKKQLKYELPKYLDFVKKRREVIQGRVRNLKKWNRQNPQYQKTYEDEWGHEEMWKPNDFSCSKVSDLITYENEMRQLRELIVANQDLKYGDYVNGFSPCIAHKEFSNDEFKESRDTVQILKENLCCYYTKMNSTETALGLGMKITRIPRTGEVQKATSTEDLLSLRAFIKKGIRMGPQGSIFGYWLPVYLGINKDRTLHLAKRSLSYIMTTRTEMFDPLMAPKILMRAISTTLSDVTTFKKEPSVQMVRRLVWYQTLLLMFCREYPEIVAYIDGIIEGFLECEEKRHKDNIPNLKNLLVAVTFSQKYSWKDVIETYFKEQLCRQVMWILMKIPELEDDTNTLVIDENRVEVTFATQKVGYRMTVVQHNYVQALKSLFKTPESMLEILEQKCCMMDEDQEKLVCKALKEGLGEMINYDEYFERIGAKSKTQDELIGLMKEAVKDSRRKKYHGDLKDIIYLPEKNEQVKNYMGRTMNLVNILEGKTEGTGQDWDVLRNTLKDKKWDQLSDDDWKELAYARWDWVKNLHTGDFEKTTTPGDICKIRGSFDSTDFLFQSNNPDVYKTIIKPKFSADKSAFKFYGGISAYPKDLNWQQLFTKFDLEEHVFTLQYHKDFKGLFTKTDFLADSVTCFTMYICPTFGIKSGYFYINGLLKRFKNLKTLIIRPKGFNNVLPMNALVNLSKGLENLKKSGGQLQKLVFYNCQFKVITKTDASMPKTVTLLDNMIKSLDGLESLSFINTNLLDLEERCERYLNRNLKKKEEPKKRFYSIQIESLKELNLVSSVPSSSVIYKVLGERLRKNENLEYLKFSKNRSCTYQSGFLDLLKFFPSLKCLDLSNCQVYSSTNFSRALFKILLISKTIEAISVENVKIFDSLTLEFFKAVGMSKTLKYLNFNYSLNSSSSTIPQVTMLSKSLSINANKGGNLEELHIKGLLKNSSTSYKFIDEMWTSPNLEETWYSWYGTQHKAEKELFDEEMIKLCNLKTLVMDDCHVSYFNYIFKKMNKLEVFSAKNAIMSHGTMGDWKYYYVNHIDLVANLRYLCLSNFQSLSSTCQFENFCEVLKRMDNMEVLQLDKCNVSTAHNRKLCKAIKVLPKMRLLNLYHNSIGVKGAKSLCELSNNHPALQFFDIGFNKVRDQGFKGMGLSLAKNTTLKGFAARKNNISNTGFKYFFDGLGNNKTLTGFYFKGNNETTFALQAQSDLAKNQAKHFFVDFFYRKIYLNSERVERSLWVEDTSFSVHQLIQFFESNNIGVVVNVRKRVGEKYETVANLRNFYIVEFCEKNSVELAMIWASKKDTKIGGRDTQFFRAGSSTFYFSKHCKSKNYIKKREDKVVFSGIAYKGGSVRSGSYIDGLYDKNTGSHILRDDLEIGALKAELDELMKGFDEGKWDFDNLEKVRRNWRIRW